VLPLAKGKQPSLIMVAMRIESEKIGNKLKEKGQSVIYDFKKCKLIFSMFLGKERRSLVLENVCLSCPPVRFAVRSLKCSANIYPSESVAHLGNIKNHVIL